MSKQTEALRLADALEHGSPMLMRAIDVDEAAAELRRLHALNVELLWALKLINLAAGATGCNVSWIKNHAAEAIAKATGEHA